MRTIQTRTRTGLLFGVLVVALSLADARGAMALEIGKPAPDFTLSSTAGQDISLRQFRGQKLVLIEFFVAALGPT